MRIKKDDTVMVISGKDKGKKGKVMVAMPADEKVIVAGANIATKHKKARGQNDPGGIIKKEAPIHVSNVKLVCSKCGQPTRIGMTIAEDGTKTRVCKKCGAVIDK